MIFDNVDIVFKKPRTSDKIKRPGYSDNKKKQELLQFVDQYCRGEQYHRNINFYPEQDLLYLSSETNDSITSRWDQCCFIFGGIKKVSKMGIDNQS